MAGLLSETINHGLASIMLILILLFTLVWEDLTDRLEESVQDQEHYAAMVSKVYRELMILGFISFSVVLSNEFDFWEDYNDLLAFEFAHLIVFFVSLFYVVTTIVASERLEHTNKKYKRIGNLNANVLADNLDRELRQDQTGAGAPKSSWSPLWLSMRPSGSHWEDCEWKIIRLLFLKEFKIGSEFDYGAYLKRKLNTKLSHSLHVHPTTWALVMVLSAVFYLIRMYIKGDEVCDCDGHRRLMEMGTVAAGVARRQLGGGGGSGCDCDSHRRLMSMDRRQLGAKAPPPPPCTYESEGALFNRSGTAWYCSPYEEQPYNVTIGNQTEMVCVLDRYNAPNATDPDPYVNPDALVTLLAPGVFSFLLFFSQGYVLFTIKHALHKVLELKGCKSFRQMPNFLRELDAWVTMKSLLPTMPLFEGCGDDFLNAVMNKMELKFIAHGTPVVSEGETSSSMHFICNGCVDIKTKGGQVLGSLVSGDFLGETSLLLDQPRTTNVVARTPCAYFELQREQLQNLRNDYPLAIQKIEAYAQEQHATALQGKWEPSQMSRKATARHTLHEQMIEEQSQKLKKEELAKKTAEDENKKTLKLPSIKKPTSLASGAAKAAASTLADPTKLVVGIAKVVGLPGTALLAENLPGSGGGGHGHGHGHGHQDAMTDADKIMTHAKIHFLEEISEITMLFNCFVLGYYCLHAGPVIIPINFHNSFLQALGAHMIILAPAFFLMVVLQPLTTKYSCMLDNVLFKDQEAIAETYHNLSGLIFLKNQITVQLMKVGTGLAYDQGITGVDITVASISKLIFDEMDKSGDGRLEHSELRAGLSAFGVYLSRKEFRNLISFVDPDMDGDIQIREWTSFLTSTEEQLLSGEWDPTKKTAGARTRLAGELVRKAMSIEGFGSSDGVTTSTAVGDLAQTIFTAMDEDNSDSLSIEEISNGLDIFGVKISEDDMDVIADYIAREGEEIGGSGKAELSLAQWQEFLATHEKELPPPGDEWQLKEGEIAEGLETTMLEPSARSGDDSPSRMRGPTTFEAEEYMNNPLASAQNGNTEPHSPAKEMEV